MHMQQWVRLSNSTVTLSHLPGPPPPPPPRLGPRERPISSNTTLRVPNGLIHRENEGSRLRGSSKGVDFHHGWLPDTRLKVVSYVLLVDVYTIPLESWETATDRNKSLHTRTHQLHHTFKLVEIHNIVGQVWQVRLYQCIAISQYTDHAPKQLSIFNHTMTLDFLAASALSWYQDQSENRTYCQHTVSTCYCITLKCSCIYGN